MEILKNVFNTKINKTIEKVMKTQNNYNNSNKNMICICFKFINFLLKIDYVIQNNLELQ